MRIAVIAVAICLIGLAVLLLRTDDADQPLQQVMSPTRNAPVEAVPPAVEDSQRAAVDEEDSELATGVVEPGLKADEGRLLTGTVVVRDEFGVEHARESGDLDLTLKTGNEWARNTSTHCRVEVAEGRWSTRLDKGIASLIPKGARLRNRPAHPVGFEQHAVPKTGDLAIVMTWLRATTLRVRDARTGVDLHRVQVARLNDWRRDRHMHPGLVGQSDLVIANASSPITLEARRGGVPGNWVAFVRSPGYAWARIELDEAVGGERQVLLDPGGELRVHIQGHDRDTGSVLSLRRHDIVGGEPLACMKIGKSEQATLQGVKSGTYRVQVEIGDWFDNPLLLGSAQAGVVAGSITDVTILLEPLPNAQWVAMSGVVILPDEWDLSSFSISGELLATPLDGWDGRFNLTNSRMTQQDEDTWGFDAGKVQAGRYELNLNQLEHSMTLEVGPHGERNVRFVIPAPGEVSVRLLDDATGEAVLLDQIHWYCTRPEGVSGGSLSPVEPDPVTGVYRFRAPQGRVVLHIWNRQFEFIRETIDVGPGTTHHMVRLQRSCGIAFQLRDGGTPIPWPEDGKASVIAVEGDGRSTSTSWNTYGMRMGVSRPGTYRLMIRGLNGFEPIPDQTVRVEAGRNTDITIQLFRKQ